MSQRGKPAAAAVVAAPILNECDDIDTRCCGFILDKTDARPCLFRNRPSCHVNRGPDLVGWEEMKYERA